MKSRRVWARRLWREQPGLHRGYLVDVATAVAIALALILGGRERTAAVAWTTLNNNGGPLLWGIVFAGIAVALIAATFVSGRATMLALWVAATLYALIGFWFLQNAWPADSTASFVGVVMFFRAATMHISRAEAWRVGPRSE